MYAELSWPREFPPPQGVLCTGAYRSLGAPLVPWVRWNELLKDLDIMSFVVLPEA